MKALKCGIKANVKARDMQIRMLKLRSTEAQSGTVAARKNLLNGYLTNNFETISGWSCVHYLLISAEKTPQRKQMQKWRNKTWENKVVEARPLRAKEPLVRSPVPVQPQRRAVDPPSPVRARRAPPVTRSIRLEAQ